MSGLLKAINTAAEAASPALGAASIIGGFFTSIGARRRRKREMERRKARAKKSQSATYLQDQFQIGQQQASLGMRSEQYQLEQQKESRLRDIQSNLLELSAYSGRNINVLEMYDIS